MPEKTTTYSRDQDVRLLEDALAAGKDVCARVSEGPYSNEWLDALAALDRIVAGSRSLEEQLRTAETTLAHAEEFIEHQDMSYRWAEWAAIHLLPRWGAGGNPEQGEWANFDLANIAQGLKGCDAVSPYDSERAYRALRKWADLLVADRKQLIEQFESVLEDVPTLLWIIDELYNGASWRTMETLRPEINDVLARFTALASSPAKRGSE